MSRAFETMSSFVPRPHATRPSTATAHTRTRVIIRLPHRPGRRAGAPATACGALLAIIASSPPLETTDYRISVLTEPWSRVLVVGGSVRNSPGGYDHGAARQAEIRETDRGGTAGHWEEAGAPVHRQGVSREPRRRPRGLDLRRARQEHHDPSGVSELRPDACAALRCAARRPPARPARAHRADGVGRLHAPILPRADDRRGAGGRARRDRGVGASHLRLARPLARLQ